MILPNRPHCKDPEARFRSKKLWWSEWKKDRDMSNMMVHCYSIRKRHNGIWIEKAHWFGELQYIRLFRGH